VRGQGCGRTSPATACAPGSPPRPRRRGPSLTRIIKQTRPKAVQTTREYVRDAELRQDNITDLAM